MKRYRSPKYGNNAGIEKTACSPYRGAAPVPAYRLYIMDESGFLFHVSVHETEADALHKMNECGGNWITA